MNFTDYDGITLKKDDTIQCKTYGTCRVTCIRKTKIHIQNVNTKEKWNFDQEGWIAENWDLIASTPDYYEIEHCQLSIGERWVDSFLVNYPVSCNYNGGTSIDGTWYKGYTVPKPEVPEGFSLVNIGIGLQLNAHPPIATAYLKPDDDRRVTKTELAKILSK